MTATIRSPVLPEAPVLAAGFAAAAWLDVSGEVRLLPPAEAARLVASARPVLCHGPATARRLGVERFAAYDLLELFAFVRPARFCLPTPRGLAEALGLPAPRSLEDEVVTLHGAMRALLAELLGEGAEARPQQADYASAAAAAFAPRVAEGEPQFVLAEAGTGVGKTLGYIAPASLWAERNDGTVWISTFTRNLQHQIDGELDRLYPTRSRKIEKTVIRKGRENYLCLLNYEESVRAATA